MSTAAARSTCAGRLDVHALGPAGFYQIERVGAPVHGALQPRRELVPGRRTLGFGCTIAVESLDATEAAVREAGGNVLMVQAVIPGVGALRFFADPDGNPFGANQNESRLPPDGRVSAGPPAGSR